MAGTRAAADPASQLVQLGQSQPFGIFDNHQAGVGDVDTDLDYRGGNQQIQLPGFKTVHHLGLFWRFHPSVDQSDPQFG